MTRASTAEHIDEAVVSDPAPNKLAGTYEKSLSLSGIPSSSLTANKFFVIDGATSSPLSFPALTSSFTPSTRAILAADSNLACSRISLFHGASHSGKCFRTGNDSALYAPGTFNEAMKCMNSNLSLIMGESRESMRCP